MLIDASRTAKPSPDLTNLEVAAVAMPALWAPLAATQPVVLLTPEWDPVAAEEGLSTLPTLVNPLACPLLLLLLGVHVRY